MKRHHQYISLVAILLTLTACLKDDRFKQEFNDYIPVVNHDGWPVSSPAQEKMDDNLLSKAYELVYKDSRFTMARSLLIIRNGKIVAEAYPRDKADMDRIENIQSMTKSFTSILTGIALQKKILDSISQPLAAIYPEEFSKVPEKRGITLRHCLTMMTGINFNNDEDTPELYSTEGKSAALVLSKEQEYDPGLVFHYHDGTPHLVSYAIQIKSGQSLNDFAKVNLFTPLGIGEWKWESASDGTTFGAFSLYMKPRDLAKFGQLLLQNGKWNGVQVVDSAWISEATSVHADSGSGSAPYGYYFWIYPGLQAYAALGHGGQNIMVFPGKRLVIVYTAWGYTDGDFFDDFNEVAQLVSNSCK